MKEKKSLKISLSTFLLFLALIVIIGMGYYIYTNNIYDNKEEIFNTDNVSYIIIEIEDTSADELSYKRKTVANKNEIKALMNIINSAKEYKAISNISDFGDIPPRVEVYLDNGEKYTIIACDNITDDGNVVNLMAKWYTEDGSDKTLFKVDTELEKYIEKLYNNSNDS